MACLVLIAGCSSGKVTGGAALTDSGAGDGGIADEEPVERTERQVGSATIGPAGGLVEAPRFKLIVPSGALTTPTLVTLSEVDDTTTIRRLPFGARVLGKHGYVVGPPGLSLARPATVEITPEVDLTLEGAREAVILFRAQPRTNRWIAAGAATGTEGTVTVSVERARDVVVTAAKAGCFSHVSCDTSVAGAYSCAVSNANVGVRCAAAAPGASNTTRGIECACVQSPSDVVAKLTSMPRSPVFYGALALLCGATCPAPTSCMPTVTCNEGAGATFPPFTGAPRWSCDVRATYAPGVTPRSTEDLYCFQGDNAPPVPGGPVANCGCSTSGPFNHPFGNAKPTVEQVLALWKEHCAPGCP